MSLFRRFTSVIFLSSLAFSPLITHAQQNTTPPDTYNSPPTSAPANPPAYSDDNWLPRGIDSLGSHASFHTDFTFNRQMLGLASDFYGDEQTQNIVGRLRSISVHIFRFPLPGLYNPAALTLLRSQYNARGWRHLVTARPNAQSPNPGSTDLWIRFAHSNVEGMVLLVSNPTNIDLIVINGTLSPLDLLHLRGHFGIPRFSGDRLVPDKEHGNYPQNAYQDNGSYSGDAH